MKSVVSVFSVAAMATLLCQNPAYAFGKKAPAPTPAPVPTSTSTPAPAPTVTPPSQARHFNFVIEVFEGPVANNRRVPGALVKVDGDSRTSDGNGFTHFWASEGDHTLSVTAGGMNGFETRYRIDREHTGSATYKVELVRPVDPNRACSNGVDNDSNSGLPRALPSQQAQDVIARVNRENPDLIRQSCREHGGNNEFLFKVVSELRKLDVRWGLNWKRGNVGDMSQDVIAYYRGGGPFSNGLDTHIVDIIGGHCGTTPQPAWIDVTGVGGAPARWTTDPMPRC